MTSRETAETKVLVFMVAWWEAEVMFGNALGILNTELESKLHQALFVTSSNPLPVQAGMSLTLVG